MGFVVNKLEEIITNHVIFISWKNIIQKLQRIPYLIRPKLLYDTLLLYQWILHSLSTGGGEVNYPFEKFLENCLRNIIWGQHKYTFQANVDKQLWINIRTTWLKQKYYPGMQLLSQWEEMSAKDCSQKWHVVGFTIGQNKYWWKILGMDQH